MKKLIYIFLFACIPFAASAQNSVAPKMQIVFKADCDKNNPQDPHYGEIGYYDQFCQWHIETRRQQRIRLKIERLQKKIAA